MKKISPRQYGNLLFELCRQLKTQEEIDRAVAIFLHRIKTDHRLGDLPKIAAKFEEQQMERQGFQAMTVTSARVLHKPLLKSIAKVLGSQATPNEKIDAEIIGGVIIESKNTIFDASIKSKLTALQHSLINVQSE